MNEENSKRRKLYFFRARPNLSGHLNDNSVECSSEGFVAFFTNANVGGGSGCVEEVSSEKDAISG